MMKSQQQSEIESGAATCGIVAQLNAAVRKLPECGDAGKLRGIAQRLAFAAGNGAEPLAPLARRFADAVHGAVDSNPWVAVHRLARKLLDACEPGTEGEPMRG